jgi:hypothetical protein
MCDTNLNLLDSRNPDILFGCETWLNPNITDNEILPENTGYNIFCKDRKDGYGGVMGNGSVIVM